MRRTFYRLLLPTLIALSLALSARTVAQDTTDRYARPNVLKTNLLAPPSLFYERALTRRFALRLSTRGLRISRGVYENQSFVNVAVEGKVYTAKPARLAAKPHPTGFFVSPYLKARSMRYIERIGYGFTDPGDLDEIQVKGVAMGLTIGYQWVSHNGFVVELFHGGGGFLFNNIRHTMRYSTVVSEPNDYLKIDFRTGVSLGYAF